MALTKSYVRLPAVDAGESLKPLPWIKENIVRFEWQRAADHYLLRSLDAVDLPGVKIDPNLFEKVTAQNLSKDIINVTYDTFDWFEQALQSSKPLQKFVEWWKELAARKLSNAPTGKLFQFDFYGGPWQIPWELLLGLLVLRETRQETALVRCLGQPDGSCSSLLTDRLRILMIKADAPDLQLDSDVERILATWNGLEKTLQKAVQMPKVIAAEELTILHELRHYRPHMIWFLGHGVYDGGFHLVFSPNHRVSAQDFAQLFETAGYCPQYAVFWACKSSAGLSSLSSDQPDLFAALSSKGVATMVGMQSSIADDAAIVMASQLFRGIGQGLPLEWAISWARTWIYEIRGRKKATLDWAAPVVWMSKRPVARLNWKQTELDRFQLQLLGLITIEQGQEGAGLGAEPPDEVARLRASHWLPSSMTVVRGDPTAPEHKLWFLRTLKGIQAISERAVLVISLVPEDNRRLNFPKKRMQDWAQAFLASIDDGRLPEDFFTAIDLLGNAAEIGWPRVCALRDIFLAVIDPPAASETWFWKPFFDFPERRAILTSRDLPEEFSTIQANYDQAGQEVKGSQIDEAMQEHRHLLTVLSLLNIPVQVEPLEEQPFDWRPRELFEHWSDLFVKSFAGYVVRADTREHVLSSVDGETLAAARLACLDLIDSIGHDHRPYLKEIKIRFLLEANIDDRAVREYSDLLDLYRNSNDQLRLRRALMNPQYFKLNERLTSWEHLQIARFWIQFGEQPTAFHWLGKTSSENLLPVDLPLKLALEAEAVKNQGDLETACRLIKGAIEASRNNLRNRDLPEKDRLSAKLDILRYRHDRARLLHFQAKNYKKAAVKYLDIIKRVEKMKPSKEYDQLIDLLAIAHRNLAECTLDLATLLPQDRFREAERHYQTALVVERERTPSSHLLAEIYYQLARLADQQHDLARARQELENCITAAEESRHGLMAAIAKNRLLWIDVEQNALRWEQMAPRWELIADSLRARRSHTWSARTLINSNLRAAHLLMSENQHKRSEEHLEENLKLIRENVKLRRGGDLVRIIETLAGLQLLSPRHGSSQEYWGLRRSEFPEAGKVADEKGWKVPQDIW